MNNEKLNLSDNRNYTIEILRIVSCFFIVYDHGNQAHWAQQIGDMALIIFILISSFYLSPQKNFTLFFRKRIDRLTIPWLFWFIFYGLLHLLGGKSFLEVGNGNVISYIFSGTRSHLWYLPFIFIMSVITVIFFNIMLDRHKLIKNLNLVIYILIPIALLISMPIWRPFSLQLGTPWWCWFLGFPSFFMGIAFSNLNSLFPDKWEIQALYAFIIISISIFMSISGQALGIPYTVAPLLFVLALNKRFNITRYRDFIMQLSGYTFGIYLIHPFIYTIDKQMGFTDQIILPIITYAISLLLIHLAFKIPFPFIKKII